MSGYDPECVSESNCCGRVFDESQSGDVCAGTLGEDSASEKYNRSAPSDGPDSGSWNL